MNKSLRILEIFFILILISMLNVCCKGTSNKTTSDRMKIVSLAPSITLELLNLGSKDEFVGATSYCSISHENKNLIVGSAIEINIEKILLLKPDLVIATPLTKNNDIESLIHNGIKVHQCGKINSYSAICKELQTLGLLVNKKETADSLISITNNKIDSLKQYIPNTDSLKMFFQIGSNPLFAVIPNTFMNDLITMAGCKNICYDMSGGILSRETVVNRNPDIIYIATMGVTGVEEKNIWEKLEAIGAIKNKKIFLIDSDIACMPSVSAFYNSLEQIIREIYGTNTENKFGK